jgi:hypothetical protein
MLVYQRVPIVNPTKYIPFWGSNSLNSRHSKRCPLHHQLTLQIVDIVENPNLPIITVKAVVKSQIEKIMDLPSGNLT